MYTFKPISLYFMAGRMFSVSAVNTHRKLRCSPVLYIVHALPRYLSPTCLAMSSELKQSSAKLRIVPGLFYQRRVPYFSMKYYSRQGILPSERGNNWVGINDLQVHICYNTNTGGGNWEEDLMTSLMLPQITPRSSTMYGSGKRYKIMSKWE